MKRRGALSSLPNPARSAYTNATNASEDSGEAELIPLHKQS
jgi:hypothetical protein